MFRIGEFSTIARVSKRLLQYYDEIGLFKPAHIDPYTGYRSYSAAQLPQLNRILALKDLGLTLDQIAAMVQDAMSDTEIQGMLRLKQAELEHTLREDLQRLRRIEARLQHNVWPHDALDVIVTSVPAQPFLSLRTRVPSPAAMLELVQLIQHSVPARVRPGVLGPLVGVVYTDAFTLTDNDVALGYILKQPVVTPMVLSDEYMLDMQELPPVATMATAVQAGGPDLVFGALERIGQWIEANGYGIAGPYREIGIALPGPDTIADMVIEVQMPIAPVGATPDLSLTH